MRIKFEMSGGYGGLFATKPLALDVNTEGLPDETRNKLIDMVEASGVRHMAPNVPPPASSIRDAFQYAGRFSFTQVGRPTSLKALQNLWPTANFDDAVDVISISTELW